MTNKPKIFISGMAGFLGSHLAESFIKKGYKVVGCDSLIGGYLDNVPPEAEFYQYDCTFLNSMRKITKDADLLDQIFLLFEYLWQGNQEASDWLHGTSESEFEKRMFRQTAKKIAQEAKTQRPSEWWDNLWTSNSAWYLVRSYSFFGRQGDCSVITEPFSAPITPTLLRYMNLKTPD